MANYMIVDGQFYDVDELKHYGVVGMKWGHRRAQKKGTTYTYTSWGTKKYKRKAEKARLKGNMEKAKRYLKYHKKSVELDRKMQKNALSNTNGKVVAKVLLRGFLGGKTYESVKASAGFKNQNANRAIALVASHLTGPFGAGISRALYVRD